MIKAIKAVLERRGLDVVSFFILCVCVFPKSAERPSHAHILQPQHRFKSTAAINKCAHRLSKWSRGLIPNRLLLFPFTKPCAENGEMRFSVFVCVCVRVAFSTSVPASFSSRQTPSAHRGGFPNNPIVKAGEMRNMATLQTQ